MIGINISLKHSGYYAGSNEALSVKGQGKYWFDKSGLYFYRYLTFKPIFIEFKDIINVFDGKWDTGKWGMRNVKFAIIEWLKNGNRVKYAFLFSNNEDENLTVINYIKQHINK